MNKLSAILFGFFFGIFSSMGIAQDANSYIEDFLALSGNLKSIPSYRITNDYISNGSGVRHINFDQELNGLLIKGTASSLHLDRDNRLIYASNLFTSEISEEIKNSSQPAISPLNAVQLVARHMHYNFRQSLEIKAVKADINHEYLVSSGGVSKKEIPVKLSYSHHRQRLHLVWNVDILEPSLANWWSVQVDALTGEILGKYNRMMACDFSPRERKEVYNYNTNLVNRAVKEQGAKTNTNDCSDCYEVFAFPIENPNVGDRTIVESPAHPVASPYGWHDIDGEPGYEFLTTEGNNTIASEGYDNNGFQPSSVGNSNFTSFPFDPVFSYSSQSESAAITNMFYWTNIIHDITYVYGFDERAGNFQYNNYDREGFYGRDNDPVEGSAQNSGCNAFFGATLDGESPLMVLTFCEQRDGAVDSTVILHEYAHGINVRLAGGAFNYCDFNKENMKEGWSDWFSIFFTAKQSDVSSKPRPIATFLFNQDANDPGIRTYPYSTNFIINPDTYASLEEDMGKHRVGSIWGAIYWEVTRSLIDTYGFDSNIYNFTASRETDAGNIMALAIAIEALKFVTCRPGFVDARDAVIVATTQLYGSEVACVVWEAFARRGLGGGASQGDVHILGDEIASFDLQESIATFNLDAKDVCRTRDIVKNLNGGYPYGGVYSGAGVIDNGDGYSFNFDPSIAGIGSHDIIYSLPQSSCSMASSSMASMNVFEDTQPPEILSCKEDIVLNAAPVGGLEMPDFSTVFTTRDACNRVVEITQTPAVGSLWYSGKVEVLVTAMDRAGNSSFCTFNYILPEATSNQLFFAPNPVQNDTSLFNKLGRMIHTVEFIASNGQVINAVDISSDALQIRFSPGVLSQGLYFVRVNYDIGQSQMFKLAKL